LGTRRLVTNSKARRVIGITAIAAAMAVTIGANCLTVSQIFRGFTRVPWADEWAILQQFILYKRGASLWPLLWAPHWGHRFVIPRLVFFADWQWASHAPLIWLTLTLQALLIALLCALAWVLIGGQSRLLFAVGVVTILNLMLSPVQMENLVWSMQFTFPLVFGAAFVSFLSLAMYRSRGRVFLAAAVIAAAVASLTMANGILIWPVLTAQAAYLKLGRRVTVAIALLGAAVIGFYCRDYRVPELGMGLPGMLRHPVDAILLLGLLLGAALNSVSLRIGIGASLLALAGAGRLCTIALKRSPSQQSWLSALAAVLIFVLSSACSTVAGRMLPQWVSDNTPVPSRYFTMIQLFWAAVAILVLYSLSRTPRPRLSGALYAAFYLCLILFNPLSQTSAARDWPDFFRGVDAVGAAFIAGVPDEQFLSILWPVQREREEMTDFMRVNRVSVFSEPRAMWLGRRVTELFAQDRADYCIGDVERTIPIQESSSGLSWRVEGWAWNASASRAFGYLIIADPAGTVVGIARGGFYHGYLPGFSTEDRSALPPHTRYRRSEWLGYVRQSAKTSWTIYGVENGSRQVCVITEAVH
jgi:hypothetical protein